MSSRGPRWEIVGAGVLFTLVAAYFTFGSVVGAWRQWQVARTYTTVAGTVIRSEVVERGGPASTRGTSFVPVVTYRYAVNGRDDEGRRLSWLGGSFASRDEAAQLLARFAAGNAVTAYVDPSAPDRAVLDPTTPSLSILAMPAGLVVFGVGVTLAGVKTRA